MRIIRSSVLGYCYGVKSSVAKAETCLEEARKAGLPAYSIGALIHNPVVVAAFEEKGLRIIRASEDDFEYFEAGFALIRAHGIPDSMRKKFEDAGFRLVDSTCVNILGSQRSIRQAYAEGSAVAVVGVENHAETLCLLGTVNVDSDRPFFIPDRAAAERLCRSSGGKGKLCVVTQTTYPENEYAEIVSILKKGFPDVYFANSPCNACRERQEAALNLCGKCEAVVVVGGKNSENTLNLVNLIEKQGLPVFRMEDEDDISNAACRELGRFETIGICSGTSTPCEIIDKVETKLYNVLQRC